MVDLERIADRYRVTGRLGRGGMGVVYAAVDEELAREVAIKVLAPPWPLADTADVDRHVQRFLREARTAAALVSDHIVRVLHSGSLPTGEPFVVMERLRGEDLGQRLARQGALAVEDAVHFGLHACLALAEAHRHGIVHRDLKPANLFIDDRMPSAPKLVVLDFGIAKWLASASPGQGVGQGSTPTLTDAGQRLGTPQYMAPEQRTGAEVDERADLWSLGFVLFEALAGQPPFATEERWAFEFAVQNTPAPPLADLASQPVDASLCRAIDRCLQRDPEQRFASVSELAEALAENAPQGCVELAARVGALRRLAPAVVEPAAQPGSVAAPPQALGTGTPDGDAASGAIGEGVRKVADSRSSSSRPPSLGDATLMPLAVARLRGHLGWVLLAAGVGLLALLTLPSARRTPPPARTRASEVVTRPQAEPAAGAPAPVPATAPAVELAFETRGEATVGSSVPAMLEPDPALPPDELPTEGPPATGPLGAPGTRSYNITLKAAAGGCPDGLAQGPATLLLPSTGARVPVRHCRARAVIAADADFDGRVRLVSRCHRLAPGARLGAPGTVSLALTTKADCVVCEPCRCRDPLLHTLCERCEVSCAPCPADNRCLD